MAENNEHSAAISALQKYTACDVSDALLKLKVPNAGFISDLSTYTTTTTTTPESQAVIIAPVSTVLFVPKSGPVANLGLDTNIPQDAHWADLTQPDTLVLVQQPPSQTNAVVGGIMALRMKVLRAKGIVVAGRIRDIVELQSTGLPVWARGTSTVGSGGASKPWATQVPLDIDGTLVRPGDLAVCDTVNGVVVIPRNKVDDVLALLPKLTAADDKVKEDVVKGVSVYEAFKRHRGNLL